MLSFLKQAILVLASCYCLVSCEKENAALSTASTLSTPIPTTNDDKYYLEIDDYVPFKEDRHDSFDWKLIKEIVGNAESNVIISPFSVKLVLTLLSEAAGIGTTTAKELSSVFPNLKDQLLIQNIFKNYIKSLKQKGPSHTLNLGTNLFFDDFVRPKQKYSAQIKSVYDADVSSVSFSNGQEAAAKINGWVSNITEGNIEDVVNKGDLQNNVLLIINAIFFDGEWKFPFSNETFHDIFTKSSEEQVKVEYMTQKDYFYYFDSIKLNAKIIRMPYKGGKFSMTIVMPNTVGAINQLIQELENDGLKRLQWLMDEYEIKLTIPKFKFDYTTQLKPVLMKLGIRDIFTNDASLPGIDRGAEVGSQLKVSNIVQKSGLDVNEKGSTAYAATKVEIVNKFGGDSTGTFLANKPFLFFLEDETTGNILFAGKVIDPRL